MMMADGSNDASWPKEVPFGYADAKKMFLGVYDPQNSQNVWRSREITA